MKLKKIFLIVIFIFSIFLINKLNVMAFPALGKIEEQGNPQQYNGYDLLALKHYNSTAVFCTKFSKPSPATVDLTWTQKAWADNISAGVASIIDEVGEISISGDATKKYYYGELAINEFLCKYAGSSASCVSDNRTHEEILGSYDSLYDNAVKAYKNYSEATLNISSNNLTFTKKDNKYVSNEITVTYNGSGYDVSTNIGSVVKNDDKFKIEIPISELTEITKVSVTVSTSKTNKVAMNYIPSDTTYQSITPNITEKRTTTASEKLTGQISIIGKITIKKIDEDGKILPNVKIKIENSDKSYSKDFITTDKEIVIENLKYGEYTIKEISAPSNYLINDKTYKITLSEEKNDEVLTITNKLTRVEINKIRANDKKNLKGAKLQVQDKDGKVLYEFETTEKPYIIKGIAKGTYYLVEKSAPEGFELNKEKIKFEVDGKTEVIKVSMKNELEVKVPDTLNARSALLLAIAMFDIALGIGIITYVKKNKIEE